MQTITILYIFLAFLGSISVAYFQYYYKAKNRPKIHILLFVLKSLGLFLLLLLLINPKITQKELQNIKPVLSILADNSKSISFFKEDVSLVSFVKDLKNDKELNNKFDIQEYKFDATLNLLDSLSFKGNETNIYNGLEQVYKLQQETGIHPIILLTDGNQTIGNDYEYISSKNPVFPVVFGDTVTYKDLKISQLNVNKYSYIKNKFPVEVLLNYEGKEAVTSNFSITKNGTSVFTKEIQFSPSKKSATITTNLTSTKEGLQYYKASINSVLGEKNIKNNHKNFSVEVIDEQTKILVLTAVLHPDLGVLKKSIESNKQRAVSIVHIDNFKEKIEDYQLVVFYQPNNKFTSIIDVVKEKKRNFLFISGKNTDWNFINRKQLGVVKNVIQQKENYGAVFNSSFLTFLQKDIGFKNYPPLQDKFGEVTISKQHQTLLYQQINGVQTTQPLLATLEEEQVKQGVLLGEGIWKWRATSFLNTNSFEEFDAFFNNIVQYLASSKKRKRLKVTAQNIYPANSTIGIAAFYTDKNYRFDARASLEITVTHTETQKTTKIPFSLEGNSYQTEIENLPSGNYLYTVTVLGQNIYKRGSFKITTYEIEEQFTNANFKKLQRISEKTGGKCYFKEDIKALKKSLLDNKAFYTTQKMEVKEQNLIAWKWVLFLVICLFTVEWFVRKYIGKI